MATNAKHASEYDNTVLVRFIYVSQGGWPFSTSHPNNTNKILII